MGTFGVEAFEVTKWGWSSCSLLIRNSVKDHQPAVSCFHNEQVLMRLGKEQVGSRVAPEVDLASDYCHRPRANAGPLMYDSYSDRTDAIDTTVGLFCRRFGTNKSAMKKIS